MSWSILGRSVAGTSHHRSGTPCQDAFASLVSGDRLLLAVADGAGSASQSEAGARFVCDALITQGSQLLQESPITETVIIELFRQVREGLVQLAQEQNRSVKEFACTALFAMKSESGWIFAQIGDGAIVYRDGEQYSTVFWPTYEEYANVTNFLTQSHFAEVIRVATVTEGIQEVALLTDGLQWLALDFAMRQPHPGFFRPIFDTLSNEPDVLKLHLPFEEFLSSDAVNAKTDDDKTLLLAVLRP